MRYAEMFAPPRDPGRRLNRAPRQIRGGPATQAIATGWGPAPTGYYPDYNGEHPGNIAQGLYPANIVVDPYGTPTGPGGRDTVWIPVQPGDRYDRVDQHAIMNVTATWTPAPDGNGRRDGTVDPLTDGPARPELWNASLHYHREAGASATTFMDVPDGRRFSPVGSQDGNSTTWYVDTAASMEPYRPATPGGQMPDSYTSIPAGPAHGWSAVPVINTGVQDLQKSRRLRQQKNVRQNRLAGSTYTGQTYGQQTAHTANPPGAPANVPSWRTRG